jgi:hypothetical protein
VKERPVHLLPLHEESGAVDAAFDDPIWRSLPLLRLRFLIAGRVLTARSPEPMRGMTFSPRKSASENSQIGNRRKPKSRRLSHAEGARPEAIARVKRGELRETTLSHDGLTTAVPSITVLCSPKGAPL